MKLPKIQKTVASKEVMDSKKNLDGIVFETFAERYNKGYDKPHVLTFTSWLNI